MASHPGLLKVLPGLVNAHTHSPYGPFCGGLTRSRTFEEWMVDIMARRDQAHTPEEAAACALVTAMENLAAGNTSLIDQCTIRQTSEHVYAIAQAYEDLGLRAWVFINVGDLPSLAYTREYYPRYAKAVPTVELPEELQALVHTVTSGEEQLHAVADIIRGWHGHRVNVGLALTNPVWCSDSLLRDAAALARELGSPIEVHAEESPVQRAVSLAQWDASGIQRLMRAGVLSPRTIVAHAVQVSDADVQCLAESGCSVSHNPLSNLKLQNGIAPIGKMLASGVNVCLGSDGHSSGDVQSLFPALRVVVALAGLSGLRELGGVTEEIALRMGCENGRRLWFEGDLSRDYIEFAEPIGPYSYVWDDPTLQVAEVYVDGAPRLDRARQLVRERGADEVVSRMRAEASAPDKLARAEAWIAALAMRNEA